MAINRYNRSSIRKNIHPYSHTRSLNTIRSNKSNSDKCKYYCRIVIAFLFSHIGIGAIVVAYMIFGAIIFNNIEGRQEDKLNTSVQLLIHQTVDNMWQVTREINTLDQSKWTHIMRNNTDQFTMNLIKLINDGYDDKPHQKKWEFPGAFLFCLTVITLIGYGHIVPTTTYGRAATIIYAIFGIPLMLLFLTNIGETLATSFRYIYGKFQACCSIKKSDYRRNRLTRQTIRMRSLRRPPPINMPSSSSSHYNCTHSLPNSPTKMSDYALRHSLPPESESTYQIERSFTDPNLWEEDFHDDNYEDVDEVFYEERNKINTDKVHVPISLCMFLLISYISIGGVVFSEWEKWELHDGIYFCFITLSTIGFGDLVPGERSLSSENMIFCSLYILMGLALIAMCFNLMQEGVIHKIKTLGLIIGIIKDENDIDDDYDNDI